MGFLQAQTWFCGLTDDLQGLVQRSAGEQIHEAGERIVRVGNVWPHWAGVIEGVVQMHVVSAQGRGTVLACLPPGSWWGEGSLVKQERRRYNALAMVRTRLALIPADAFMVLRQTSIAFNHYLQDLMNERMRSFIEILQADRLLSPELRVARCVERLATAAGRPEDGPVQVSIGQQDLSLVCGLSRQRTNAALAALDALGLVRTEFKSLRVRSLTALRDFIG